jgi:kumamolisin
LKRFVFVALSSALIAGCASHGSASLVPPAGPAAPLQAAQPASAAAPPAGSIGFVAALPLRNEAELDRVLATISDPDSPQYRSFLSAQEFAARYAPLPASIEAVRGDLQRAGFSVSVSDQAVSAYGTQAQIERYFGASLEKTVDGVFAPRAPLHYSSTLRSEAVTIVGLDGIPPLHIDARQLPLPSGRRPHNAKGPLGPYFPTDFKQAYEMPSIQSASGKGVTIGIVMASPIHPSDVHTFFSEFGSTEPKVTTVNVDGGGKLGNFATGETSLDVEQSGGIAPMANIVIYNIRNLETPAVYDGYAAVLKGEANVVNSSFIGCESQFKGSSGLAQLAKFDALFKEGAARGFTWVASSGDYGKYQCGHRNVVGTSWPAVSPYVLAVGGTNLITNVTSGSNDSSYVRESAFHDDKPKFGKGDLMWGSGGGYSVFYARPSYQQGFVEKSARGVPDVALHMGGLGYSGNVCDAVKCNKDDSSDFFVLNGKWYLELGTSASSPDMAGLLALGAEIAGKPLGDVHTMLYKAAKHPGLFHPGIPGNNGFPTTAALWDPVLGLGTPEAAYKLVGAKDAAGVPGSSSNP